MNCSPIVLVACGIDRALMARHFGKYNMFTAAGSRQQGSRRLAPIGNRVLSTGASAQTANVSSRRGRKDDIAALHRESAEVLPTIRPVMKQNSIGQSELAVLALATVPVMQRNRG